MDKAFGKKGRVLRPVYRQDVFRKKGPLNGLSKMFGSLGKGMRKPLKGPMMIAALGAAVLSVVATVRSGIVGGYENGPLAAAWEATQTFLKSSVSLLAGLLAGGLARNIKGPAGWWAGAAALALGTVASYAGLDALFSPPEKKLSAPAQTPPREQGTSAYNPFAGDPVAQLVDHEYRKLMNQMAGYGP